ncbi:Major Facilitator Superfamily protein [Coccidioides posadasii C735 delta SOWgp]|uniref:Major Facilitator Superfamily protein n=1 Tax=Coccidioides posadasii (strain C735) TaxID=222929 RepID=C5P3R0_COCP7|nr:Major Facilitator Superfamily protein [Coccidioides posadasii C735 delta SOWgp]EER28328.1 Major Facilitator Superfamily protein [Coccidioides posadasii C735 delta SOWgp]|eukprot:XP_003070473.1 Major Facilitator Superfamily protein [Coccidioides posadasii C735 delta SOWgp]
MPTETSPLLSSHCENGTCPADGAVQQSSERKGPNPDVARSVWWTMPALAIGIFLSAADQTLVVASYGKIGNEYFLTLTAFQPLYGRISDLFGRKAALCFSFGLFAVGCLWCGLARSMKELIIARAFTGIGGGGMTTVVAILLSDVVPLRDRGTWQGYNNIVYASGAGLGAPLGGALADTLGWRWSFLLQVPVSILAFLNVLFVLRERPLDHHWRKNIKQVDFLGALLLVTAIATLFLGLDRGSNDSWGDPMAYGNVVASIVFFGLFLFNEAKTTCQPFAPLQIVFSRPILACLLCNFFAFGTYIALTYNLPLYWQAVESLSATAAGVRLLPGILANVCGSLFAGWIMRRTCRYRWLTICCYLMFLIGTVPVILFTGLVGASIWGIWVGMVVYGFGNGIGGTSTLVALSSGIGVSISATVIQALLKTYLFERLHGIGDAEEIARKVRESLSYIDELSDAALREAVRMCYGWAVQASFWLMAVFVCGALLGAILIREAKLGE